MHKTLKRKIMLLSLPALVGFAVFYILPMFRSVGYSFIENTFTKKFVWFDNYKAVLTNEFFLMALFCAVILFFTFFGEMLFYEAKPQVTTHTTYTMMSEIGEYKPIPKECLVDNGYVYVITYAQGFSAEITSVEKREIVFTKLDENNIAVTEGLKNGERLVLTTDRSIKDGDKVTVVE